MADVILSQSSECTYLSVSLVGSNEEGRFSYSAVYILTFPLPLQSPQGIAEEHRGHSEEGRSYGGPPEGSGLGGGGVIPRPREGLGGEAQWDGLTSPEYDLMCVMSCERDVLFCLAEGRRECPSVSGALSWCGCMRKCELLRARGQNMSMGCQLSPFGVCVYLAPLTVCV